MGDEDTGALHAKGVTCRGLRRQIVAFAVSRALLIVHFIMPLSS